jgi:type IV pilus assembly protein PilB
MALPIPPLQLKEHLVKEGLIDPERFDALQESASSKGQNLTDVLVSEKIADFNYLMALYAAFLGVEIAELGSRGIDEKVLKLLPEAISRERQVVLFAMEPDGSVAAAMADPADLAAIQYLEQYLKRKLKLFLATPDDLTRGFSVYGSALTSNFKKIIEENIQASLRSQKKSGAEAAADLPIVALVDNILSYASASRASDVHVEALEDTTMVRYRIDGILYEILRIPKVVHPALVARIKLLGGLKIDEHYEPQDGRFRQVIANQPLDIRVAVMPTANGEKIVMRLLEATQKPLALEELGMLPETAEIVSRNLKKSYGMILSCGPTGSGKTTTLYALINITNQPNVNITTIEDPIEYNMRYVNQSQINTQAGITFASGLKALLRQDPNIIMVGEIRDGETADIAVQAALTGHLLISSLHTNDAPTAIPRLFDLHVPPFLVSSTLNLVIAQRLVRKICPSCIASYDAPPDLNAMIAQQMKDLKVPEANVHPLKTLYKGNGCNACGGSGYRGRFGIFEVLEVVDEVRSFMTSKDFSLEGLRNAMRAAGSTTMFEDGIRKVELGQTTIEEVMRVIRE